MFASGEAGEDPAASRRSAHAAGLRRASISGKNRVVPIRLLGDLLAQLGLRADEELALHGEPVLPELASPLAVAECAIAAVAASLLAAAKRCCAIRQAAAHAVSLRYRGCGRLRTGGYVPTPTTRGIGPRS